jgi:hypothetical protein
MLFNADKSHFSHSGNPGRSKISFLSSKQNQTQRHKGSFDGDEFRVIKR